MIFTISPGDAYNVETKTTCMYVAANTAEQWKPSQYGLKDHVNEAPLFTWCLGKKITFTHLDDKYPHYMYFNPGGYPRSN